MSPGRPLEQHRSGNRLPVMPKPSHREKLLEAGFDVVLERGYCGASVRDIVQAAGAPQGSFTNHFASKDMFCLELLNRYFAMVEENRPAPPALVAGHAAAGKLPDRCGADEPLADKYGRSYYSVEGPTPGSPCGG